MSASSRQPDSRVTIKSLIAFLCLAIAAHGVTVLCAQFGSGHHSEAEIAHMTPEQRVDEYCREYVRNDVSHMEYGKLLADYIMRDGLKAVPALVKAINEFDPMRSRSGGDKDRACEAAEVMLSDIDQRLVACNSDSASGQLDSFCRVTI